VKYQLGERVKIKGTADTFGEITASRNDVFYHNGKLINTVKYFVLIKPHTHTWYNENDLTLQHAYEFDNKFELALLDLLIDTYLLHKKIDLVRQLHNEKKLYMR
jgi:hypothetical protein